MMGLVMSCLLHLEDSQLPQRRVQCTSVRSNYSPCRQRKISSLDVFEDDDVHM